MGCFCGKPNDVPDDYDMGSIQNHPVVFVNGVPGAGNQTVAQTIAEITGFSMIKPGELIRLEAMKDTVRGKFISEKLCALHEIPEQTIINLIKEAMLSAQNSTGFVIVGFPKNARLSNMFSKQIKCPDKIVALQVDNEVAASKLQNKLSELGRPLSEINSARNVVNEAATKVNKLHRRFGNHVVTLDSNSNQQVISETLRQVLSQVMGEVHKETLRLVNSCPPPLKSALKQPK